MEKQDSLQHALGSEFVLGEVVFRTPRWSVLDGRRASGEAVRILHAHLPDAADAVVALLETLGRAGDVVAQLESPRALILRAVSDDDPLDPKDPLIALAALVGPPGPAPVGGVARAEVDGLASAPSPPALAPRAGPAAQPPNPATTGLGVLFEAIRSDPTDRTRHEVFVKQAVASGEYIAASELYASLEGEPEPVGGLAREYKRKIGMGAAAKLMANAAPSELAQESRKRLAKITLSLGGAGLVVGTFTRSAGILGVAAVLVAVGLWSDFRSRA